MFWKGNQKLGSKAAKITIAVLLTLSMVLAGAGFVYADSGSTQQPVGPVKQPTAKGDQISNFQGINLQNEYLGQGILSRRDNPNGKINSSNAGSLKQAWSIKTHDLLTGQPVIANGKAFFADWAGYLYVADASSGKLLWDRQIESPNMQWPWHGFTAPGTLGDGVLYIASVEGQAFAIDINTYQVLWQQNIQVSPDAGNFGPLTLYNGKLIIGLTSPQEPLSKKNPNMKLDFQGHVLALDAKTGRMVWDLPLVTGNGNGVAVWGGFAVDPATSTLYFGTGNNYTEPATTNSDSVFAVNADTGQVVWSQQVMRTDIWLPNVAIGPDFDFGAAPQIFDTTVNGQPAKMVGIGQKSGYYWAFDRTNGKPIWSTFVGYANEGGGIRGAGAVSDGRILVWSNNGYEDTKPPADVPLTVKALDAATGQNLWTDDKVQPANGASSGFLSNDVFFVGSLDGTVQGYSATDGKVVFKGKVPGSVGASMLVYNDMLFVGVGVPKDNSGGVTGQSGLYVYKLSGASGDNH